MTTTVINGYCTIDDFRSFMPNSNDMKVELAEQAINAASRMIDNFVGRKFYPAIQAKLYDIPDDDELCFKDDLLEMIAFTNGDGTAITEYKLWPYNSYPKASAVLYPLTSTIFNESSTTWNMAALTVNGIWGFHSDYAKAWKLATTLGAAITTTTATSATVASGVELKDGDIIRIDNELIRIEDMGGTALSAIERGFNGSTAATHLINASVYVWRPEPTVVQASLIQAVRLYLRNETIFGTTGGGAMGLQSVAITKLDPDVEQLVKPYQTRF